MNENDFIHEEIEFRLFDKSYSIDVVHSLVEASLVLCNVMGTNESMTNSIGLVNYKLVVSRLGI